MPFVEIRAIREKIVRVKKDGKVLISKDLRDKYFPSGRMLVFLDKENKLLGLQPSDKGYKISTYGTITSKKLLHLGVKVGKYTGEWNDKHNMVVASIEMKG